jgi:hypothetical protein
MIFWVEEVVVEESLKRCRSEIFATVEQLNQSII